MSIRLAGKNDRKALAEFFSHYNSEITEKRVECYTSHNFTVIAEENEIVGVLQWSVKEDPNLGVCEFEEVHIKVGFRRKGIGSKLVEFAVSSVSDYFEKKGLSARRIFLFVAKKNKAARTLYEKKGFFCATDVGPLFSEDCECLYVYEF